MLCLHAEGMGSGGGGAGGGGGGERGVAGWGVWVGGLGAKHENTVFSCSVFSLTVKITPVPGTYAR